MFKTRICPYCQTTEPSVQAYITDYGDALLEETFFYVQCECLARGPECSDRSHAISEWNRISNIVHNQLGEMK